MLQPGYTIDVANTSVNIFGYNTVGGTFYPTELSVSALTFSSINFDGTFNIFNSQGELDSSPIGEIIIVGNIALLPSGSIPINILSQYTNFPVFNSSNTDTCATYIPPIPPSSNSKKWKLTNDNLTTTINWQALSTDGSTIIGAPLSPGSFVGSAFYGGSYPCIRDNSLTYGSGGTAIIANC